MNHTPALWVADGIFILSPVEAGRVIAETRIVRGDTDTAAADAARIAKCVNAHDELVAALQACYAVLNDTSGEDNAVYHVNAIHTARAALAKVQS